MQRGHSADSGMPNGFDSSLEAQFERLNSEPKQGLGVPESMVLETSSSFGSTSSSTSMSNMPPIGVNSEVKVASPGSTESDSSVASNVSHPKAGIYQDQVVHVTSVDTKNPESENIIFDPSSMMQMQKTIQVPGYQLSRLQEHRLQQEVQYIHPGSHYVPQYPPGPSYYPMYHPQLHSPHQPGQPYPIYLVPVGPTQPYNIPVQHNLNDAATVASNRPPLPPHTAMIAPQVAYKEVPPAKTLDSVLCNHQQFVDPTDHHASQAAGPASTATASCGTEFHDDLAYAQIYKSQPSAPVLTTTQYQTMTKAAAVLLSEASTKLDTNNFIQQVGISQP